MKTVAFLNDEGGVGGTTLVVAIQSAAGRERLGFVSHHCMHNWA